MSLNDITDSYTAGRGMIEITSLGGATGTNQTGAHGINAMLIAGQAGYPDHSQVDMYRGWGKIYHMTSWGDIAGTITAATSGWADAGGSITATVNCTGWYATTNNIFVKDNYADGQAFTPNDPLSQAKAVVAATAFGVAQAIAEQAGGLTQAATMLTTFLTQLAQQAGSLEADPGHLQESIGHMVDELMQSVYVVHEQQRQGLLSARGDYYEGLISRSATIGSMQGQLDLDLVSYQASVRAEVAGMFSQMQQQAQASEQYL